MALLKDIYFCCKKLDLISAVDLDPARHFPESIS
jgi:hypothetical protein